VRIADDRRPVGAARFIVLPEKPDRGLRRLREFSHEKIGRGSKQNTGSTGMRKCVRVRREPKAANFQMTEPRNGFGRVAVSAVRDAAETAAGAAGGSAADGGGFRRRSTKTTPTWRIPVAERLAPADGEDAAFSAALRRGRAADATPRTWSGGDRRKRGPSAPPLT
jgi:hypothetical protein